MGNRSSCLGKNIPLAESNCYRDLLPSQSFHQLAIAYGPVQTVSVRIYPWICFRAPTVTVVLVPSKVNRLWNPESRVDLVNSERNEEIIAGYKSLWNRFDKESRKLFEFVAYNFLTYVAWGEECHWKGIFHFEVFPKLFEETASVSEFILLIPPECVDSMKYDLEQAVWGHVINECKNVQRNSVYESATLVFNILMSCLRNAAENGWLGDSSWNTLHGMVKDNSITGKDIETYLAVLAGSDDSVPAVSPTEPLSPERSTEHSLDRSLDKVSSPMDSQQIQKTANSIIRSCLSKHWDYNQNARWVFVQSTLSVANKADWQSVYRNWLEGEESQFAIPIWFTQPERKFRDWLAVEHKQRSGNIPLLLAEFLWRDVRPVIKQIDHEW